MPEIIKYEGITYIYSLEQNAFLSLDKYGNILKIKALEYLLSPELFEIVKE